MSWKQLRAMKRKKACKSEEKQKTKGVWKVTAIIINTLDIWQGDTFAGGNWDENSDFRVFIDCVCLKVKVSVAQLCLTLCDPWTVANQTPLSMGFSRQEESHRQKRVAISFSRGSSPPRDWTHVSHIEDGLCMFST